MIELDKKYNPDNSGTDLDLTLKNSLPLPILDAWKLLGIQSDPEKSLQVLCLSLIPWTFQYIALIFSGEYLSSSCEPASHVTESLLNMIKKPGPGKWIGFIREITAYFAENEPQVIPKETIKKLNKVLNTKERPIVKITGLENKLEYTEALVNIRNRFAHSRSITGATARELFEDYFLVWKAWIVLVKEIFEPRLIFYSQGKKTYCCFDNRPFDLKYFKEPSAKGTIVLWSEKSGSTVPLYPVVVTSVTGQDNQPEVAFLEEIRSKYLFYLLGDNFFKLKDEFDILSELINSKTVNQELISAGDLTIKTFSDRIDRITGKTIDNFRDALKYIPEMYLDRPGISGELDKWIGSSTPGCILTGNPGTGKTSIVANWCMQRKIKGDHVLLLEASNLRESDITMVIAEELSLGSPLKDCLDEIQKQNISSTDSTGIKKFIVIIDAVNEFTGKNNESRGRLWREINSLIGVFDLYSPTLKCLVTTRSDLWDFDFPGEKSAFETLKERLYWKGTEEGFPKVMLGDLSMAEARQVFEKARSTIPSMAVMTSFDELTDKTRKAISNPFFMRLALLTYSEKEMPSLTKLKLERQYAKERIIEEKDKKKVLFTLLERMAALRKTEITIDEYLSPPSKGKFSKLETRELEKLILDPRPKSPYKKLIEKGILEERSDENILDGRERIRFSQEKLSDIIHSEFRKRNFTRIKQAIALMVIVLITGIAIMISLSGSDSARETSELRTELEKKIGNADQVSRIIAISARFIENKNYILSVRKGITISVTYVFFIGFMLFSVYVRFYGTKLIKNDLPSQFIKEKFNQLKQKKYIYGMLPIFIFLLYVLSQQDSDKPLEISDQALIIGIPVFLGYATLWEQILGALIVMKYSNSPNDVFCLFGRKEVLQSIFNYSPLLPLLLIMFFGMPPLVKLNDISSDSKILKIKEEWVTDPAVVSLKKDQPQCYFELNEKLFSFGKSKSGNSPVFVLYTKVFLYSIFIIYPLILVLQYYMGFWLYKILKRRL